MSRDFEIIKAEIERNRQVDSFLEHTGLIDKERRRLRQDFDLLAKAMQGIQSAKFPALKCLVRRFGRAGAHELLLAAADKSYHDWRLVIRQRRYSEQPDMGSRARRFERQIRTDRIGLTYYRFRADGLDHREAISQTRSDLQLNLSDQSSKREIDAFRLAAKKRGYVNPHAPFSVIRAREPDILVADLTKKGRPRKMVQNTQRRKNLFPIVRRR